MIPPGQKGEGGEVGLRPLLNMHEVGLVLNLDLGM